MRSCGVSVVGYDWLILIDYKKMVTITYHHCILFEPLSLLGLPALASLKEIRFPPSWANMLSQGKQGSLHQPTGHDLRWLLKWRLDNDNHLHSSEKSPINKCNKCCLANGQGGFSPERFDKARPGTPEVHNYVNGIYLYNRSVNCLSQ